MQRMVLLPAFNRSAKLPKGETLIVRDHGPGGLPV